MQKLHGDVQGILPELQCAVAEGTSKTFRVDWAFRANQACEVGYTKFDSTNCRQLLLVAAALRHVP